MLYHVTARIATESDAIHAIIKISSVSACINDKYKLMKTK